MITGAQLRGFAGLGRLGDHELEVAARAAHERSFDARYRIFSEGEPASGCWLIVAGHVALEVDVPGRGEVVVQTLGAGDLLGWSWLVPPYRWHFAATAVDAVSTYEFDTESLRAQAQSGSDEAVTELRQIVTDEIARLERRDEEV